MNNVHLEGNSGNRERILIVDKEIIPTLFFPSKEVLFRQEDMDNRARLLSRANILGNVNNIKVQIQFEDIEGVKMVETTIWGVTDKAVILKKNHLIPINRIVDIKIV